MSENLKKLLIFFIIKNEYKFSMSDDSFKRLMICVLVA